jgi:hypothetical protein
VIVKCQLATNYLVERVAMVEADNDLSTHFGLWIIILEGRRRVGGRIYSHPLHSLKSENLPDGLVPKGTSFTGDPSIS